MPLQANAVDFGTSGLERLDEVERGGGFGAGVFDVVVVVVGLYGGVGGGCGLVGNGDVFRADGVVEDVGTIGAVVVEGFIYDILGITFAFAVGHFIGDVVL
jgi:hypothetical protein